MCKLRWYGIIVAPAGILAVVLISDCVGETVLPCDVHQGPCKGSLSGREVTLEIFPKPVSAMRNLVFRLALSDAGADPGENPFIDLGMPGMHMGPNRVALKPATPGIYEGQGILVRCPSGIRSCEAKVTVPGYGTLVFKFDVRD